MAAAAAGRLRGHRQGTGSVDAAKRLYSPEAWLARIGQGLDRLGPKRGVLLVDVHTFLSAMSPSCGAVLAQPPETSRSSPHISHQPRFFSAPRFFTLLHCRFRGALQLGIPRVGVARMVLNIGIEGLLGAAPFIGDLFDVVFKANRRNYVLLNSYLAQPQRQRGMDWLFLLATVLVSIAAIALPIWLLSLLIRHLA